jgi:CBS domain-containing protein
MPLEDVERHMQRRRVARVFVVRDGEVLGIISAADLPLVR